VAFPSLQPVLAVGVTPELNVYTVVGAIVLVAIAVWFVVISHAIATNFRSFGELDKPNRAITPGQKRTESDERELTPAGRASPR